MLVIGLTGGIGSGKSAVADAFRAHGVPVIDADVIARQVVEPPSNALDTVIATFGADLLDAKGHLDRARLAEKVFSEPQARRRLEAILHPAIRAEMVAQQRQIQAPYCVLVIPLLLETDQTDLVDRILVVDAPEALCLERAVSRDRRSEAQVRAIMDSQLDRESRLQAADDVIVNDGTLGDLRDRVAELHARYRDLAARSGKT